MDSKTRETSPGNRRRFKTLLEVAAGGLLALAVFVHPGESEARLNPFYIVQGQSYGEVAPRILFVLDNSGSMAFDETYIPGATFPDTKCWWTYCENSNGGLLQSRVNAARDVITTIFEGNKDRAEFALMTFGTATPPTTSVEVPMPCHDNDSDEDVRFTWIETSNQPYSSVWKAVRNTFNGQGIWTLCGDNRPFPYLRHDNLGAFSLPNNSAAELPDTPLYSQYSDKSGFESNVNYGRKVQWFPRFVGRRANLDCGDVNQDAIAMGTYGDWGNTNSEKSSDVCGHDFYYWPYVDGNPGYSYYSGKSADNMTHQECDDDGNCVVKTNNIHRIGVTRRNQLVGATLYAPFYSEAVIDDLGVAPADKGPLTLADAELMFEGITDKQFAGGADVTGGTPLAVAAGVVEWMVTLDGDGKVTGPKPVLANSNAPFSHSTIASYLSFMALAEDQVCRPVTMIIITDGQPDPWWKQGGSKLYKRLRSIRKILGVKSYVVAFSDGVVADPLKRQRVHEIACSAAGGESDASPCTGANDYGWETCRDPENPVDGCAWLASNHEELSAALVEIVDNAVEFDVPGGTPTVANDFQLADPDDPESEMVAVQTALSSWTEVPAWRGHLVRGGCTDEDPDNPGQLADYCLNAGLVPLETEESESFGPCALGRTWDAGACLELTPWADRRLYTHGFANEKIRIASGGAATPEFESLVLTLNGQGKIDPPLTLGDESDEIQAMVEFIHGADLPADWKLPGLSNSAPVLIRRVPKQNSSFLPSVGIRDPHCAGRRNVSNDNVPTSLQSFASSAWGTVAGGGFGEHYDYAEAALVGDDFGILHAFHYDSGNELFGFMPMALINNARILSVNGPASFGQPTALAEHIFGVASTVNAGWVYDEDAGQWRHLAVFGLGPGGSELITIDVSHMGRLQDDDPFDVLWTSSTTSIATQYADTLGETWSRPALTYAVPNDQMGVPPKGYLVFGSGYRNGSGDARRGRVLWAVDAITGESVTQRAYLAPPDPDTIYDEIDDLTAVNDIAVGSHCLSRYWGEMQEAYVADPAGRLYRWDLAAETSNVDAFPHTGDSGGTWPVDGDGFALATEGFRFPACQGTDEYSCTVGTLGAAGVKGDVFTFSPAIVANDRIDTIDDPGDVPDLTERDQFLIALVSGNPNDTVVDGGDDDNDFHSSIYLIADDHRLDSAGGFDIPANGVATAPGSHAHFMRLPLNQIERTRTIIFPGGDEEVETRNFSKQARPIRAPMIRVTGLAEGTVQSGAEVYYVTFTIYEPAEQLCDGRWYDTDKGSWILDPGATYELTFRLVLGDGEAFDFTTGYSLPNDYGDGFGTGGGLTAPVVEQVGCDGENCGAVLRAPSSSPCDPNADAPPVGAMTSVQTGAAELEGFSPLEIQL